MDLSEKDKPGDTGDQTNQKHDLGLSLDTLFTIKAPEKALLAMFAAFMVTCQGIVFTMISPDGAVLGIWNPDRLSHSLLWMLVIAILWLVANGVANNIARGNGNDGRVGKWLLYFSRAMLVILNLMALSLRLF